MTKILLVANTGWYLYNFRRPLARLLREQGVEVVLVSPRDAYVDRLQEEGFRWVSLGLDRRSVNPLREAGVVSRLVRLYRAERPTAVHHFTVKCMLYGTLAAKISRVPTVVNAVTGLGHLFVSQGWKARLLRPYVQGFYRAMLTDRRVRVIFQNPDDLKTFSDLRLIDPSRSLVIRSSGVDLTRFTPPTPVSMLRDPENAPAPVILFASRLTRQKGLVEFVEAAERLKASWPDAVFRVVGDTDPGNPSSLDDETLERWRRYGAVEIHPHQDTVEEAIAAATMVVLPSYREGVPRILLEAAAMGKPLVTTDVPGCREAVVDGENGLLVPVRDSAALAGAIHQLLSDPQMQQRMGRSGRRKMVAEFDDQVVARKTVAAYSTLGQPNVPTVAAHEALAKAA